MQKNIFYILQCVFLLQFGAVAYSSELIEFQNPPSSIQKNSLLFQSWSKRSQYGEEGILDAILKRLNITDGFFAEFGGWDGEYLSNTRFLADRGWRGAFIEADSKLSIQAQKNCRHLPKVQCICEFVTWDRAKSQGKTFDQIADQFFPKEEIDVLSIDIDGPDYLILESLKRRPKIIIIEGGICWFPTVSTRIPDIVAKNEVNQPLSVIFDIARKKGYKPVCFTINTFFVREDLFAPFEDIKNDPLTLWFDSWNYYKQKTPGIASYVRKIRASHPWIRQFDPFVTP